MKNQKRKCETSSKYMGWKVLNQKCSHNLKSTEKFWNLRGRKFNEADNWVQSSDLVRTMMCNLMEIEQF